MVFSYGITYLIENYAGFKISFQVLLAMAAALELVFFLTGKTREKKVHLLPFILSLLAGGIIWYLWKRPEFSYVLELTEYLKEWKMHGPLELKYGWPVPVIMLAFFALLYRRICRDIRVKLLVSLSILPLLVWQALEWVEWDLLPAAALLYVSLSGITEAYQHMVQKRTKIAARDMFPFLAGVVILASVLPAGSDPISWEPVQKFFHEIGNQAGNILGSLADWGGSKEFEVGSVGFSEKEQSFWGKLSNQNPREIMKVLAGTYESTKNRYFTGRIKEIYEKNNWMTGDDSRQETEPEYQMAMQERLYYLWQSGLLASETERFCRSSMYKIRYTSLETQALFYPQNCYEIKEGSNSAEYVNQGVNIRFPKQRAKHEIYQVYGLQINLEQEGLKEYLQNPVPGKAAEGKTLFEECTEVLKLQPEEIAEITDEKWEKVLRDREKRIEKTDLQLPKELPERIRKLAQEITKQASNDYNKAQAVRSYLKKEGGYEYTLSPEELPKGEDAVDYFLFESRQGYCTHFASAAVLLCRAAGIPARYVEGIAADYEEEEDGWYSISANCSHAWYQVYIRGFGWIDMDAVPGYETESGNWEIVTGTVKNPYEDKSSAGTETESGEAGRAEANKVFGITKMKDLVPEIILAGVLAVGVLLLVLAAGKGISMFLYKRMENRKKAELGIEKLCRYLKKQGKGMQKGETLRMYAGRLDGMEEKKECSRALLWYEGIRYGEMKVSEKKMLWLEELCRREKKKAGRVRRKRKSMEEP